MSIDQQRRISAQSWSAELSLALVCLIWGTTFVLVKSALADVSPVLFLALRFSLAALVLAVLYLGRGGRLTVAGAGAGMLTGSFLYAGYLFQTLGLRLTTPATSGFLTGLYVVMVPVMSAIFYRTMPGVSEWLGIVAASVGMGLLTLNSATLRIGTGEWLTVGCAVCFALHILMLGHFSRRLSTEWLSLLQIASSAAIGVVCWWSIPSSWWEGHVDLRWTPNVIVALAVTSLLATALAFSVQTWAQSRTTPTRAALIFSLEPVFAWATSWLVEGEVLSARAIAGAGCILAGILLVELKPARGV